MSYFDIEKSEAIQYITIFAEAGRHVLGAIVNKYKKLGDWLLQTYYTV